MKKTVLTLAAVLALSGTAFAGTTHQPNKQAPAPACVETKTGMKLDCGATGSVEKTRPATDVGTVNGKAPRIGIDINPWIMPSTF
jgi:hypothetical protein